MSSLSTRLSHVVGHVYFIILDIEGEFYQGWGQWPSLWAAKPGVWVLCWLVSITWGEVLCHWSFLCVSLPVFTNTWHLPACTSPAIRCTITMLFLDYTCIKHVHVHVHGHGSKLKCYLSQTCCVGSKLNIQGRCAEGWVFEESWLDENVSEHALLCETERARK